MAVQNDVRTVGGHKTETIYYVQTKIRFIASKVCRGLHETNVYENVFAPNDLSIVVV